MGGVQVWQPVQLKLTHMTGQLRWKDNNFTFCSIFYRARTRDRNHISRQDTGRFARWARNSFLVGRKSLIGHQSKAFIPFDVTYLLKFASFGDNTIFDSFFNFRLRRFDEFFRGICLTSIAQEVLQALIEIGQ